MMMNVNLQKTVNPKILTSCQLDILFLLRRKNCNAKALFITETLIKTRK